MTALPQEQIVLAALNGSNSSQSYRPRLIEFYGYEGEDFRHFQEILESFLAISNTNSDTRKLIILKSQLRRAAKTYFERVILKEYPNVTYTEALDLLKNHYITPELIQNYEMEFSEMQQGEQEHPQIFLARLREAADLANITSEEAIQSRFRAGLLREIKQFCIQSSSRDFKDWTNHAEGWWNAHRPRKIAMVDNPFIPRNVNTALIYQNDNIYTHHPVNNHNVELVDTGERSVQYVPINDIRTKAHYEHLTTTPNMVTGPTQLTTMEVVGRQSSAPIRHNHIGANETMYRSSPEDLVNLIQQAIRDELNIPPKLS